MTTMPNRILGNLADWELPSLEGKLSEMIDYLKRQKITIVLNRSVLGEPVWNHFWDLARELGATAANEAIAGWLQGGADGCPELAVQWAFLEDEKETKPFSISYSVAARDGSLMKLRTDDLREVLMISVERDDEGIQRRLERTKIVAAELRKLAHEIERAIEDYDRED